MNIARIIYLPTNIEKRADMEMDVAYQKLCLVH